MSRMLGTLVFTCLVVSVAGQSPVPQAPGSAPTGARPVQASGGAPLQRQGPDDRFKFPVPPARLIKEATDPAPLPKPSMTEPGAIGLGLHDPSLVPDAVVSLLTIMGVVIGPPSAPASGAADADGRPILRLSEAEVRGLIAMGIADAEGDVDDDEGPYSFADLHAAVAPMLPRTTPESLAKIFAAAYEDQPDALVPQVLMGEPIEAKTPLMRTQIWLLLVDGFSTAAPNRASAELPWGVARKRLQPLHSPDPRWTDAEWGYLVAHVMLLGFQAPFEVILAGGKPDIGKPFTLELKLETAAPAIVHPVSGRALLTARAGASGSRAVTWTTDEADVLSERGTIEGVLGRPVQTDRAGVTRVGFVPTPQEAPADSLIVTELPVFRASMAMWDLASSRYDLPVATRGFLLGSATASRAVPVRWRAPDAIAVKLANEYDAKLPMGPLGLATRQGYDAAQGVLARQKDGSYRGVWTYAFTWTQRQTLSGLAQNCSGEIFGRQDLLVIARPVRKQDVSRDWSELPARRPELVASAEAGGGPGSAPVARAVPVPVPRSASAAEPSGYLRLEFYVASPAVMEQELPCPGVDEWVTKGLIIGDSFSARQGGHGRGNMHQRYIPFKDPGWTRLEIGIGIPVPAGSLGLWEDIEHPRDSPVGYSRWIVAVARGRTVPDLF